MDQLGEYIKNLETSDKDREDLTRDLYAGTGTDKTLRDIVSSKLREDGNSGDDIQFGDTSSDSEMSDDQDAQENSVENSVQDDQDARENSIENSVQDNSVENSVDNSVHDNSVENSVDNSVENSVENSVDNSVQDRDEQLEEQRIGFIGYSNDFIEDDYIGDGRDCFSSTPTSGRAKTAASHRQVMMFRNITPEPPVLVDRSFSFDVNEYDKIVAKRLVKLFPKVSSKPLTRKRKSVAQTPNYATIKEYDSD